MAYELVCDECATLSDRLQLGEADALQDLALVLADNDLDQEDAMAELYYRCDVDAIPAHAWHAAAARAFDFRS